MCFFINAYNTKNLRRPQNLRKKIKFLTLKNRGNNINKNKSTQQLYTIIVSIKYLYLLLSMLFTLSLLKDMRALKQSSNVESLEKFKKYSYNLPEPNENNLINQQGWPIKQWVQKSHIKRKKKEILKCLEEAQQPISSRAENYKNSFSLKSGSAKDSQPQEKDPQYQSQEEGLRYQKKEDPQYQSQEEDPQYQSQKKEKFLTKKKQKRLPDPYKDSGLLDQGRLSFPQKQYPFTRKRPQSQSPIKKINVSINNLMKQQNAYINNLMGQQHEQNAYINNLMEQQNASINNLMKNNNQERQKANDLMEQQLICIKEIASDIRSSMLIKEVNKQSILRLPDFLRTFLDNMWDNIDDRVSPFIFLLFRGPIDRFMMNMNINYIPMSARANEVNNENLMLMPVIQNNRDEVDHGDEVDNKNLTLMPYIQNNQERNEEEGAWILWIIYLYLIFYFFYPDALNDSYLYLYS